MSGFLKRTLLAALIVSVLLVLVIVALDFFGAQPQPFQYLLQ
ncbi:MAG: hypothetical protein ACT4PE_13820 [Candidatus Eiseniibacteriota bacterium]